MFDGTESEKIVVFILIFGIFGSFFLIALSPHWAGKRAVFIDLSAGNPDDQAGLHTNHSERLIE